MVPNDEVRIAPELHHRGISSYDYTLRPDEHWTEPLLAAARPTMPPGYPDELVLDKYRAGLAQYALRAVGTVNRSA
jgi:hypothetical protein